jgi:hypothetical protein
VSYVTQHRRDRPRQHGARDCAQSRSRGALGGAWDIAEAARTGAGLSSEVALVPPSQFGRLGFILFVVPGSAQIEEMLPGAAGAAARRRDADRSHHLASGKDESTRREGARHRPRLL